MESFEAIAQAHDLAVLQAFLESRDDPEIELLQRAVARKNELYGNAMSLGEVVYAKPVDDLVGDFARGWAMRRGPG